MFDEFVDGCERASSDNEDRVCVVGADAVVTDVDVGRRRRVEVSYRQHTRLAV